MRKLLALVLVLAWASAPAFPVVARVIVDLAPPSSCGSGTPEVFDDFYNGFGATSVDVEAGNLVAHETSYGPFCIGAGEWSFHGHIQVGTGGGPANSMNVLIEKVTNPTDCTVIETIMSGNTGTLSKGSTTEVSVADPNVGMIQFFSGQTLLLTLSDGSGAQSKAVWYNFTHGAAQDGKVYHPDTVGCPPGGGGGKISIVE